MAIMIEYILCLGRGMQLMLRSIPESSELSSCAVYNLLTPSGGPTNQGAPRWGVLRVASLLVKCGKMEVKRQFQGLCLS